MSSLKNKKNLGEYLTRILTGASADVRLEELAASGMLRELSLDLHSMVGFGGLEEGHKDLWDHVKRVVVQAEPRPAVRWAALFHDVGKVRSFRRVDGVVCFHGHEAESARSWVRFYRNWRLFDQDPAFRDRVEFLIHNLGRIEAYTSDWTESAVRRFAKEVEGHLDDLATLSRADVTTKHDHKRRAIHARIEELQDRVRAVAAKDSKRPLLPKGLGSEVVRIRGVQGKEIANVLEEVKAEIAAGRLEPYREVSYYVPWLERTV